MDYLRILRVKVVKRIEQLIGPGQNLIAGERTSFASHHLRQIIAGDKLHHEKLSIAFRKMVAYTRQSRMMQTSEKPRLAFELLAQTFIGKQRLFQSDGGIETLIDGLVNCAHTALPELANDTITAL